MSRQHNKKITRTNKRGTHKKRNHKRRTYKRRTNRFRRLIPNSTVSIFNEPEKIILDTEHNKSGNIIPGLRKYLGNI
jgi:hypothetical protein